MLVDLFALVEFSWIFLSALLAKYLYLVVAIQDHAADSRQYLAAGVVGAVAACSSMRTNGLYARKPIIGWLGSIGRVVASVGIAFLILLAIAYMLKVSASFSRGWFLTWFASAVLGLVLIRVSAARLLAWLSSTGRIARRMAIVTDRDEAELGDLVKALQSEGGIKVVGIFPPSHVPSDFDLSSSVPLVAMLQARLVDEIVVVSSERTRAQVDALFARLSVFPVDLWFRPYELSMPVLGYETLDSTSMLLVLPKPIRKWGYVAKAAFDYILAAFLVVLLSPLLAAIAVAIRWESKGQILFRQKRHGLNHSVIEVYKFRTMTVMENGGDVRQAQANDKRVTRIGRVLRATSLDELPQLFNVLRGEMSIVGPRPHAVAHNEYYMRIVQRYADRHRVKPGITGLAQVSGFRGPTEDPEKMRQRVRKDLEYIANWSLWLDMKILCLTVVRGFVHPNAL